MNKNILVLDDNLTICLMLKSWLVKKGYKAEIATSVETAKQMVKENPFDLILSDIRMPEADGFSFLSWVKKYDSDVLVIMMTGFADIESAVESIKSGAVDYISKPIDPELLFSKMDEAFDAQKNTNKSKELANDFVKPPGNDYKQLFQQLDIVAENNRHLLIVGDRGTGKVSAVKYIYDKGFHPSKPFVILDSDQLEKNGESGYRQYGNEKTLSFTEGVSMAKGGLLFIRKVHKLTINYQTELLSLLTQQQKNEYFTQIIVSSEKSKSELQKALIPKLYQLLEKESVTLPSLAGRNDEIMFLASYFLKFANLELDKNIQNIDSTMQQQFVNYPWPENIQELKNSILKAALLTDGTCITADIATHLFGSSQSKTENNAASTGIEGLRKENYEKEKIQEALTLSKGNKTMAASILNIDRKTLYNKIKLYDVEALN